MGNVSGYNEVSLIEVGDGWFYYVENVAGVLTGRKVSPERLAGFVKYPVCEGRLTLESGVPISAADQLAKTSIFFTPYRGNRIGLYDGTRWNVRRFTQLTQALGTLVANSIYDQFVWDNAGTPTLELGPVWSGNGQAITGATTATPIVITATAHGLANGDAVYIGGVLGNTAANGAWIVANQTANTFELSGSAGNGTYTAATGYFSARSASGRVVLQDGIPVRAAQPTRRHLGTFRTVTTTTTEDSVIRRFLWNRYNQVGRRLISGSVNSSPHGYTTAAWREWNGGTGSIRVGFVIGDFMPDGLMWNNGDLTGIAFRGQGLDSLTGTYTGIGGGSLQETIQVRAQQTHDFKAYPGYHFIAPIEFGGAGGAFSAYNHGASVPG